MKIVALTLVASHAMPAVAFAASEAPAPLPNVSVRDDAPPRVGHSTTLVTEGVVEELTVTYSPSSNVQVVEKVKANGTDLVLWRPKQAGVVSISAPGHAPKRISIRFDGVPMSGIVIMVLAGLILFGGAFTSLRALLAEE